MKSTFFLVILVIAVCFLTAETISLSEARELALKNNLDLLASSHSLKAARWDVWNAASGMLPSLKMDASYTEFKPDFMNADEQRSFGYSISQPIFNGGGIWLGYRIKNDLAKIASASFTNRKLATIANIESKYFNVLENQDFLVTARTDLQSSELNLEIAEARYETGTLSRADLLQMQSLNASKEVTMIQLENFYKISRIDLANFLQIETDYILEDITFDYHADLIEKLQNLSPGSVDNIINDFIEIGSETNPNLLISEHSKSMNSKSHLISAGNFLPSLNLSYSHTWDKYNYQEEYEDSERLMLIASVPLFPIIDNVSAFSKARHELKKSTYEYNSTLDGIKLGTQSSVYNLLTAAKSVSAAKIALNYARETYQQMEERFKNNLISTSELLDVEVLLTSSKNQFTRSFFDLLRARSVLLQNLGSEDDYLIISIIDEYFEEE